MGRDMKKRSLLVGGVALIFSTALVASGDDQEALQRGDALFRPISLPQLAERGCEDRRSAGGNAAFLRITNDDVWRTVGFSSSEGDTYLAIEEAACSGSVRELRALISQMSADREIIDVVFDRALMAACRAGSCNCARELLVRHVYKSGVLSESLLNVVKSHASKGCRERLARMLLRGGADPNYTPRGSFSVLREAVKSRCPGVVQELLADSRTDSSDTHILIDAVMIRKNNEHLGCCIDEEDPWCSCLCRGNDFDPACCLLAPNRPCQNYFLLYCFCLNPVLWFTYLCPAAFCSYLGWRLRFSDDRRIERILREHYHAKQTVVGGADSWGYEDGCGICCMPSCRPCSCCKGVSGRRVVSVME